MGSARYTRSGLIAGAHTSDQVARREAAIEQVRALLAEKPMSTPALAEQIGLSSRTVYGYLVHLEDMGEVVKLDAPDAHGRKTWALDSEEQRAASDRAAAEHERRAWIVPARQVGMWRDELVAALFGPARRVA